MNRYFQVIVVFLLLLAVNAGVTSICVAGDWPQVLGPNRDGHAVGEQLDAWTGELKVAWQVPCGAGYGGVAVSDNKVYLWHRLGREEILDCLSTTDGRQLWRQKFSATYTGGVDPDQGPRCVPVVHGEHVVVNGASGDLHAVATKDGAKLWSRSLRADYDADEGYFGAGSTPIVYEGEQGKQLVIVEVGGRKGSGLVAVNLSDGKTSWQTLDSEAAYASPVVLELGGRKLIAALMRLSLVLVEPETGKVVAEFPFGKRGPTVNAATPIIDGNNIFLTASYGIGCKKWRIIGTRVEDLWKDNAVISSQYVTPVLMGDFLYAVTGREDMGVPGLCCVSWTTGKQHWLRGNYGTAHLIAAGDKLIAQHVDGSIELIAADPQECKVLASSKLPEGTYRSLPALSNGVIYCRRSESARGGQLLAIKLNDH